MLAFLLGLSACAPAAILTPTLTATPVVRSTLPPTWTPTPTYTPAPPLPTATLIPTPSATSTLEAAGLCAAFAVDTNLDERRVLGWNMVISMLFQAPAGVTIRFLAVNHLNPDSNRGVDVPGAALTGFQLPVNLLPGPGIYDWTVSLHTNAYGDICTRGGWFIAISPQAASTEEAGTP